MTKNYGMMSIYELRDELARTRDELLRVNEDWRGTPKGNIFKRDDINALYNEINAIKAAMKVLASA